MVLLAFFGFLRKDIDLKWRKYCFQNNNQNKLFSNERIMIQSAFEFLEEEKLAILSHLQ